MRFEKAINIYSKDGILKRFQANETKFSVIEGSISSIISEKEILELQNGHTTMYTKLGQVTQTASELKSSFTDFKTQYDEAKKDYTEFKKSTSEHTQSAENFTDTVTEYMNKNNETVKNVETKAEQTAKQFKWLVKSGTSETDFTLTDRTTELLTETLIIKNKDGSQTLISGGKMDIEEILTQNLIVKNKDGSRTLISGGKMDIDEIFSQNITATGTITGGTIKGTEVSGPKITGGQMSGTTVSADSMTAKESYSIFNGNNSQKILYFDGSSIKLGKMGTGTSIQSGAGFEFFDKTITMYGSLIFYSGDVSTPGTVSANVISASADVNAGGNYNGQGYVQCNGLINTYSEYQSQKGSRDWRFGSATGNGDQDWFGFYDYTSGWHGGIYGPDHSLRMNGMISGTSIEASSGFKTTEANAFRAVNGNYGFIIRNDGTNVYFMPTNYGDQYGAWNDNYSYIDLDSGQWCLKDNKGHRQFPVLTSDSDTYRVVRIQISGNNFRFDDAFGTARYCTGSTSDIRLKDNINNVEVMDALSVVNSIQLHSFDWKDSGEHQRIGFIADELEQLDPKFAVGGGMTEEGGIDAKVVDSFYLLGYITKAMQELSQRVSELEKENEKLKRRLNLKED